MRESAVLSSITEEQAWALFRQSVRPAWLAMLDELLLRGRTPEWILEQNVSTPLSPVEESLMFKAFRFRQRQLQGGAE